MLQKRLDSRRTTLRFWPQQECNQFSGLLEDKLYETTVCFLQSTLELNGQEVQWALGALLHKMRHFPLRFINVHTCCATNNGLGTSSARVNWKKIVVDRRCWRISRLASCPRLRGCTTVRRRFASPLYVVYCTVHFPIIQHHRCSLHCTSTCACCTSAAVHCGTIRAQCTLT